MRRKQKINGLVKTEMIYMPYTQESRIKDFLEEYNFVFLEQIFNNEDFVKKIKKLIADSISRGISEKANEVWLLVKDKGRKPHQYMRIITELFRVKEFEKDAIKIFDDYELGFQNSSFLGMQIVLLNYAQFVLTRTLPEKKLKK